MRHPNGKTSHFAKISTKTRCASFYSFISFLDPKSGSVGDILPLRIENRCTVDCFSVRQKFDQDSSNNDGRFWSRVNPLTHAFFALDKVLIETLVEIKIEAKYSDSRTPKDRPGSVVISLDLNEADNVKKIHLESFLGNDLRHVFVFVEHSGPVKSIIISEISPKLAQFTPFGVSSLSQPQKGVLDARIKRVENSLKRFQWRKTFYEHERKFALNAERDRKICSNVGGKSGKVGHHTLLIVRVWRRGVSVPSDAALDCTCIFGPHLQTTQLQNDGGCHEFRFKVNPDYAHADTIIRLYLRSKERQKKIFFSETVEKCRGIVDRRLRTLSSHKVSVYASIEIQFVCFMLYYEYLLLLRIRILFLCMCTCSFAMNVFF